MLVFVFLLIYKMFLARTLENTLRWLTDSWLVSLLIRCVLSQPQGLHTSTWCDRKLKGRRFSNMLNKMRGGLRKKTSFVFSEANSAPEQLSEKPLRVHGQILVFHWKKFLESDQWLHTDSSESGEEIQAKSYFVKQYISLCSAFEQISKMFTNSPKTQKYKKCCFYYKK